MSKAVSRLLLSGWAAFALSASPLYSQPLEESLASLSGLPREAFTLAQLNYFFDAARTSMGTAVDSARGWLEGATSASAPRRAAAFRGAQAAARPYRTPVVPAPAPAPAYRRTFRILLEHPETTDRYDELILKYSRRYGLDPRLVKAVIAAESEFIPGARSPRGAVGLMQVMPGTARIMLRSPFLPLAEPGFNIMAGAAYLNELFTIAWRRYKLKGVRFQDAPRWLVQRVIAAYNAGPRFLFRNRWYRQTRDYVRKVLLFYQSKVADIRRPQAAGWFQFSWMQPKGTSTASSLRVFSQ